MKRSLSPTPGTRLRKYRNYKEYWVCAACGQVRWKITPLNRPCSRCSSDAPPRLRISHRKLRPYRPHITDGGDTPTRDSRTSDVLHSLAKKAVLDLSLGISPGELLEEASIGKQHIPRFSGWFCQVFLDEHRYKGFLAEDPCCFRIIAEVKDHMTQKKMMQIRIPTELHKWFKLHAAKNDTTMTQIIISYIRRVRQREEKSVKVEQI